MRISTIALALAAVLLSGGLFAASAWTNCNTSCYGYGNMRSCNTSCY